MGLFQKAYETYENHKSLVGEYSYEDKKFNEPLAPVGHIVTSAGIEITLTADGVFISASTVEKDNAKTIIPVTEESSGRTGTCAHPLCDNMGYLIPTNREKNALYLAQLSEWESSEFTHPILTAVLKYVKSGTILDDLAKADIKYSDKDTVRWAVIGLNDGENIYCHKNSALFEAYTAYYLSKKAKSEVALCMVTGNTVPKAEQHIKGVSSFHGNAKLISANDTTNYTFRGRFKNVSEALTVGYEASQKAHNALKWLIANQGVRENDGGENVGKVGNIGGRTFLCWNPNGKKVPQPLLPFRRSESQKITPSDYRNDLFLTLNGYKKEFSPADTAVIAVFDAATTGRLAVTYYSEVLISDYLERLAAWDETCCWKHNKFGISSPSLRSIVQCAYGTERGGKLDVDDKIEKGHLQRLLRCRLDGSPIPRDIVFALFKNTMRPSGYDKTYGKLQFTACAVIRKYYIDYFKEEYKMALERDRKDISYQYGRLLAILDKAERDTYESGEERETNAGRLQTAFCTHPLYSSKQLIEQVKTAYYPRLRPSSRIFYDNLIGEVMEMISAMPESQWNAPLKETYVLGYYLQKNELYSKKDKNENTEEYENE